MSPQFAKTRWMLEFMGEDRPTTPRRRSIYSSVSSVLTFVCCCPTVLLLVVLFSSNRTLPGSTWCTSASTAWLPWATQRSTKSCGPRTTPSSTTACRGLRRLRSIVAWAPSAGTSSASKRVLLWFVTHCDVKCRVVSPVWCSLFTAFAWLDATLWYLRFRLGGHGGSHGLTCLVMNPSIA